MLVTFRTSAYSNITMFGDKALYLLRLMGHSETVPGAILGEDVPAALATLQKALAAQPEEPEPAKNPDDDEDEEKEPPVPLARYAYPLVELLKAAAAARADVMWDK